jgi:hypothetical protein
VLEQPLASVNVKFTLPGATPVTVLPLTVALEGSLLTHVPPEEGVKVMVLPTHTEEADVLTVGFAPTVTLEVVFLQPVLVCVKVKVTFPGATPVTTPELVTVATDVLLLVQTPPVEGDKVMVLPAHTEVAEALTVGSAFTVTAEVVALHPEVASVNVKVTLPAATPVAVLPLTVALLGSSLTQVPPVAGDKVMVLPIQTEEADVLTVGPEPAVIMALPFIVAEQPVVVLVAITV